LVDLQNSFTAAKSSKFPIKHVLIIFIHWSDKKTVANKRKKEKKT